MTDVTEPKTTLPSYWESGRLYMKSTLAYEATQVFDYYAREVHENQIDELDRENAVTLAKSQAEGFRSDGVLAQHVPVPFAKDDGDVMWALSFLTRYLERYDKPYSGISYRIDTYRSELKRQHQKAKDHR